MFVTRPRGNLQTTEVALIACRLTRNENAAKSSAVATQGNFQPGNDAQFVCPTTGQELNGRFRFCVLRNTGHVISERALKQVTHGRLPAYNSSSYKVHDKLVDGGIVTACNEYCVRELVSTCSMLLCRCAALAQ